MIDSYDKLSIGKYLELMEIVDNEEIDEVDKNVEIVALLDDRPVEMVYDLPLMEFNSLMQKTNFLQTAPKPLQVSTKYNLGGMKLETVLDLTSLTTAQFIDYQTFVKDKTKMVELLSVFLIPKGKKYNTDYDIIEVQKVIRENLPITVALGMSAFFFDLYKALLTATTTSSVGMPATSCCKNSPAWPPTCAERRVSAPMATPIPSGCLQIHLIWIP